MIRSGVGTFHLHQQMLPYHGIVVIKHGNLLHLHQFAQLLIHLADNPVVAEHYN